MIKDLNLEAKSIKFLEGNIGINLHELELGNSFLDMTQKYKLQKKKYIKWTSSKLKTVHQGTLSIK